MPKLRLGRLAGRAGLYLITASLLMSGVLRIAGGAGEAIAQAIDPPMSDKPGMAQPVSAQSSDILEGDGIARLISALRAREDRVAERERRLAERMEDLSAAEKMLATNLEALKVAEKRLEDTLARADGALDEDIGHLTRVYETMKPSVAATLFEEMDPKFAAGFLARMSPAAASGVMAGMSPEAAYSISLIFAGRHVDVPTQ